MVLLCSHNPQPQSYQLRNRSPLVFGNLFPLARAGMYTGTRRLLGPGNDLRAFHISPMLARCAGSMLYCRLYRFFRLIGGTNLPVRRHRSTPGAR